MMTNEDKPLNKKQFMQQYVLNRALGNSGGLDGRVCSREAQKAYKYIEEECKDEKSI